MSLALVSIVFGVDETGVGAAALGTLCGCAWSVWWQPSIAFLTTFRQAQHANLISGVAGLQLNVKLPRAASTGVLVQRSSKSRFAGFAGFARVCPSPRTLTSARRAQKL